MSDEVAPAAEVITGLMIAQIALVRVLERELGLRVQDYVDELERMIDAQTPERQKLGRYEPLRMLIGKLSAKKGDPRPRHQ